MLKNNTKIFVQKFNFAIQENFVQLMKENNDQMFETIKHVLKVYQNMNTFCDELQRNLTFTTKSKNRIKIKIQTQKTKFENMNNEHQQTLTKIKKLKSSILIKNEKMNKLRKSRNAHRENFEKINVKIKFFVINKKIMQKTIKNLKRKLTYAQQYFSLNDSNRENLKSSFSRMQHTTKTFDQIKMFRRENSFSTQKHRHENESTSFSKHKYFELLIFYENSTK